MSLDSCPYFSNCNPDVINAGLIKLTNVFWSSTVYGSPLNCFGSTIIIPDFLEAATVKSIGCPLLFTSESLRKTLSSSDFLNLAFSGLVINKLFFFPPDVGLATIALSCIKASTITAATLFCICGLAPGNFKTILGLSSPSFVAADLTTSWAIPKFLKKVILLLVVIAFKESFWNLFHLSKEIGLSNCSGRYPLPLPILKFITVAGANSNIESNISLCKLVSKMSVFLLLTYLGGFKNLFENERSKLNSPTFSIACSSFTSCWDDCNAESKLPSFVILLAVIPLYLWWPQSNACICGGVKVSGSPLTI